MSEHPELIVPSGGDWTSPQMDYKAFRAAGHSFAMRYAVPSIPGKMVTRAEVQSAHNNGIDVGFVYEVDGTSWTGGRSSGLVDGERARLALESIGAPHSVACYHAVDEMVADDHLGVVQMWIQGVMYQMQPYRTGIYGQYSVVEAAFRLNPSIYRWQTQAWSSGHVSQHADILQLGQTNVGGVNIDLDLAYAGQIGQWYANASKQPHSPTQENTVWGQIQPVSAQSVPIPSGSATMLTLFTDVNLFGGPTQHVRVALHSAAKGWAQIETVAIQTSSPVDIAIAEHDVNAISFLREPLDGSLAIGYFIS